jgi:ketosteroid isomerase-like protein
MIEFLLATATAVAAAASSPPADDAATLRALDQALLDAIAPGDRAAWERALAPDAVYVDEDGHVLDRAAFLAAIEPLPAGLSGQISISDYRVRLHGDTALVVQALDEREDYHGLPLRAGYLVTETWLRQEGRWRLALVHADVVRPDPPALVLPAAALDDYVGRYAGPGGMVYEIRREGAGLVGGKAGGTARPLLAEMPDLFFVAGQPRSRKLFQRDAGHAVTGFVDRREGEDIAWTRLPQ